MPVENADSYTMTDVSRNSTGEYKCSLIDDPTMEATEEITVKCKKPKQGLLYHKRRNHYNFATLLLQCHCTAL